MARGILQRHPLNVKELRGELSYNKKTGEFRWLKVRYPRKHKAGSYDSRGYLVIGFKGFEYKASRLAFLLVTGKWPNHYVDHIDGNPSNNRWSNLRDVMHHVNCRNKKRQWNNTSGQAGVQKHNDRELWIVMLASKYIGCFKSKKKAIELARRLRRDWRAKR